MPSKIMCLDAWRKGWTTICSRRLRDLLSNGSQGSSSLSASIAVYRAQAKLCGHCLPAWPGDDAAARGRRRREPGLSTSLFWWRSAVHRCVRALRAFAVPDVAGCGALRARSRGRGHHGARRRAAAVYRAAGSAWRRHRLECAHRGAVVGCWADGRRSDPLGRTLALALCREPTDRRSGVGGHSNSAQCEGNGPPSGLDQHHPQHLDVRLACCRRRVGAIKAGAGDCATHRSSSQRDSADPARSRPLRTDDSA